VQHQRPLGEARLMSRPRRIPPPGFAENAHLSNPVLQEMFGIGEGVIRRLRKQVGRPYDGRALRRAPLPADWAEQCARLGKYAVRAHYACGIETIDRWIIESGIRPIRLPRSFGTHMRAKALTEKFPTLPANGEADQAAHHLRKHFPNVYRADVLPMKERKHLPKFGVGSYVVGGRGLMLADAVVALARSYGFTAVAEVL
jgi:hypothetical protein